MLRVIRLHEKLATKNLAIKCLDYFKKVTINVAVSTKQELLSHNKIFTRLILQQTFFQFPGGQKVAVPPSRSRLHRREQTCMREN